MSRSSFKKPFFQFQKLFCRFLIFFFQFLVLRLLSCSLHNKNVECESRIEVVSVAICTLCVTKFIQSSYLFCQKAIYFSFIGNYYEKN